MPIDTQPMVRVFLEDGSELRLPRKIVAMSLVNDWPLQEGQSKREIVIPESWANGDSTRITVERFTP